MMQSRKNNLTLDDSNLSMRSTLSASSMSLASSAPTSWFILDVAGKEFRAMKASLCREPGSILALIAEEGVDSDQLAEDSGGLISYDSNTNRWQIDGNSEYFDYILKYLRTGKFNAVKGQEHSLEDLCDEAELFRLHNLANICKQRISERATASYPSPITHPQYYTSPVYPQQQQYMPQPPPGIYPPNQMGPPPGFESTVPITVTSNTDITYKNTIDTKDINGLDNESIPCTLNNGHTTANNIEANFSPETNSFEPAEIKTEGIQSIWAEPPYELKEDAYQIGDDSANVGKSKQYDVGSTIFMPPAEYFQLIDCSKKTVSAFELVNGRMHNYQMVTLQRKKSIEQFLDSLSKEKTPLFLEHNDFDELGGSIGNILFYMQWLNIHYPDGCYIADYANFEDSMRMAHYTQDGQVQFDGSVPTAVFLLENKLMDFNENAKLIVDEEVTKLNLFCLPQNLCSNLFRFLKGSPEFKARIKDLLPKLKSMVPIPSQNSPSVEDLLSIINQYPIIFELHSLPEDNFLFETAWLRLTDNILSNQISWRLVLDCPDDTNLLVEKNSETIKNAAPLWSAR